MKLRYLTTKEQVVSFIDSIPDNPNYPVVGFDLETTGLDCHSCKISTAQICIGEIAWVIDMFTVENAVELLKLLLEKLKSCLIAGHNLVFEIKFLWAVGIDLTGYLLFDTQLASTILTAGLDGERQGLAPVAERYLQIELDKTKQKSDWSVRPLSQEQLIYAAKDAWVETVLQPVLAKAIATPDDDGFDAIEVFKLEHRCMFALAEMEYYGAKVDLAMLEELRPFYEGLEVQYTEQFLSYVKDRYIRKDLQGNVIDEGISMSSSVDMLRELQKMGIPNPAYLDGDKEAPPIIQGTSAAVIKLLDWNDYPMLEPLSRIRGVQKLLTSYINAIPRYTNKITGRMHTHYNAMVSTGRISSSDPPLQTLPRPVKGRPSIRACFIPEEGYILCGADYSQIEVRVIAEVSQDEVMLDDFLTGKDPYASTAAIIGKIPYSQMETWKLADDPEYKDRRQKAKAVKLGYNYCMGYKRFRLYAKQQFGQSFTLKEAEENRKTYFSVLKGLSRYHESVKDKKLRHIRTMLPYSRKRQWPFYPGVSALSNHPIQGTSGDIQKLAMSLCYERLHAQGYSPTQSQEKKLILTVH